MKQLICEMCGSSNFVKTEGLFICQACGMKYSLEEAKNMIKEVEEPLAEDKNINTIGKEENIEPIKPKKKKGIFAIIIVLLLIGLVIGLVSGRAETPVTTIEEVAETPQEEPVPIVIEDPDVWKVARYADEFGDPTGEEYITTINYISGTFSNSATTNSNLLVDFAIDDEYVAIFLLEYGNYYVKNSGTQFNDGYDITIKTADGKKLEMLGLMYTGGDRVVLEGANRTTFINLLKGNKDFTVYMESQENTTTNYLFTVPVSNFSEVY